MGGFMSGLYSVIGPKLEELHTREDATRAPRAQMYTNILTQSDPSSPQYKEAWEQLNKIYGKNKQAKEILGRIQKFTDQMPQRAASGQQALPAPGQAPPVQPPDRPNTGGWRPASPQEVQQSKATQAAGPGMTPPPSPSPSSSPSGQISAEPHQGILGKIGGHLARTGKNIAENFGVGIDQRLKEAREAQGAAELGAQLTTPTAEQQKARALDLYRQSVRQGIASGDIDAKEEQRLMRDGFYKIELGLNPLAGSQKPPARVSLKMKDGSTKMAFQVGEEFYDLAGHAIPGDEIVGEAPKPSSARAAFGSKLTHIDDAIKFADQDGEEYIGMNGKPLDLQGIKKANPNVVLQPVAVGQEIRWNLTSPEWKKDTIGNIVYQRTGLQPPSEGTPVGQARTGTETISPITVFNEETQRFEQQPGIRQPESPGIEPPSQPAAPPNSQGNTLAPPTTTSPAASPAPLGPRAINTPAGQFNQIQQRATPVRLATTQIFVGDPQNPAFHPMIDYWDLTKDEGAKKRIALAVRLARSAMLQGEQAGGEVSAHIGPISASTGGLGSWATNAMGVPVKITEAQNQQMRDAIEDMQKHNPREVEAFNQSMSMFGTVGGLRRLTGGSAAQATIATIENEIPLIGYNTLTPESFAQRMASLAEEVNNGAQGLPKGALGNYDPAVVRQKIDSIRGKKSPPAPSGQSGFDPDAYIDQILKAK